MRINFSLTISLSIAVIFFSCKNDDNLSQGDLIWQKEYPKKVTASTMDPIIFGEVVVYSNDFIQGNDLIVAYDLKSGMEVWTIENPDLPGFNENSEYYIHNNKLFLFHQGELTVIDEAGNIMWTNNDLDRSADSGLWNNKDEIFIYGKQGDISSIFSIEKSTGNGTEVIEFSHPTYSSNIWNFNIFEKNNLGFLVFNVRYINNDFSSSFDSTFVYNSDDLELLSKSIYLGEDRVGSLKFHEEFMFTTTEDHFVKIDLFTEEIVWSVPKLFEHVNHINFHADGIYFVQNKSLGNNALKIIKRSLETGHIIWQTDHEFPVDRLTLFNSNLYVNKIGGKLLVFNTNTGVLAKEIISPDFENNSSAFFDDAITVDPNTGDIYTANFISALKFKNVD